MADVNSRESLREAILALEIRQASEREMLREQSQLTYESLRPINLLKSTFKEAAESQDVRHNLVNAGIGLAAGHLTKIVFERVSSHPLKKLIGSGLLFSVSNLVAKHPEVAKTVVKVIFQTIRNKPNGEADETSAGNEKNPIS